MRVLKVSRAEFENFQKRGKSHMLVDNDPLPWSGDLFRLDCEDAVLVLRVTYVTNYASPCALSQFALNSRFSIVSVETAAVTEGAKS